MPARPVVLVSSSELDVPFDLHHIRVIYYDVNDPFWGEKLIAKVAENIIACFLLCCIFANLTNECGRKGGVSSARRRVSVTAVPWVPGSCPSGG